MPGSGSCHYPCSAWGMRCGLAPLGCGIAPLAIYLDRFAELVKLYIPFRNIYSPAALTEWQSFLVSNAWQRRRNRNDHGTHDIGARGAGKSRRGAGLLPIGSRTAINRDGSARVEIGRPALHRQIAHAVFDFRKINGHEYFFPILIERSGTGGAQRSTARAAIVSKRHSNAHAHKGKALFRRL